MLNPMISFLLFFLLASPSFLASCGSEAVDPRPRALPSFKIQEIKLLLLERLLTFGHCFGPSLKEEIGSSCSYTVKIKTSCSSGRFTSDRISLAFGDAYRNEVFYL
ncbi:hypothetical protein GW17_00057765 [Ensete ventricosum]|uniref:Uncharacterized protein n=1 Tax=Ensete ventricosum TaxID=4639 RepID=A0A427A3N4_ENSVE|nr:hypothetical protein B296_00034176 [Ensete ventricosum]RWV80888.1 hypothetical protein GW17_00057765 [Ensete ventricosum]RZS09957.1 hypothetical protein BHM03_00041097 [Ensete ventricosum]